MNPIRFHSCLARQMQRFVELRQWTGRDYGSQALSYFDHFLSQQRWTGQWVTPEIVNRYRVPPRWPLPGHSTLQNAGRTAVLYLPVRVRTALLRARERRVDAAERAPSAPFHTPSSRPICIGDCRDALRLPNHPCSSIAADNDCRSDPPKATSNVSCALAALAGAVGTTPRRIV